MKKVSEEVTQTVLQITAKVFAKWQDKIIIRLPKYRDNESGITLKDMVEIAKKDVENAFLIRKLLYRDKFSIEGARQALKDVKFALKKEKDFNSVIQRIDFVQLQIKNFVDDIKKTKKLFK